jgi:hypothetical protein
MNGFERPVVTSHQKIGVDPGFIFPIRRKSADHGVENVLLVKKLVAGAQVEVQWVIKLASVTSKSLSPYASSPIWRTALGGCSI